MRILRVPPRTPIRPLRCRARAACSRKGVFMDTILERLKSRAAISRKIESNEEPLKWALNGVAQECGFAHWAALKQAVDSWFAEGFDAKLYPPRHAAYLNHWF